MFSPATTSILAPVLAPVMPVAPLTSPLLLVEDNFYNAKLMLIYLKKLGYEVLWAQNGREMWQLLEQTQPALVLMDINLPETDGLILTQQLRSHSHWHNIPIIVQTAMAMLGDRETCFQAGASGYITKPLDLRQLAGMIVQCLEINAG
jgi:CheY-like chemotaxis protein